MIDPARRSGYAKLRRKAALAVARLLRLPNEEKGATAVEFALVALPFIFLTLSLLELAMVFLIYTTLESALGNAARTIRTGAAQTSTTPPTASTFAAQVCNGMGWLQSTCTGSLQVDVRTETQFSNPSEPDPYSSGVYNPASTTFNMGTAGQIVLVRAFYSWPLVLPVLDAALSTHSNGAAVIIAATTFINEPYT